MIFLYLFLTIELVAVAYLDFRTKKIINLWSLLNIVLFIVLFAFNRDLYPLTWKLLLLPSVLLVIGYSLFTIKVMGGGDAKFLSTFFLTVPLGQQDELLWLLIYSTIIIGGIFLIYNFSKHASIVISGLITRNFKLVMSAFGTRFAYAPVILMAWLWLGIRMYIY